jgi:hypothetical protein
MRRRPPVDASRSRRGDLVVAVLLVVAGWMAARGGPAALAAPPDLTPIPAAAVDPSRCTVPPRPDADFVAVDRGTPFAVMAAFGTPVATPVPPADGRPADPATSAAATATFTEAVACLYAGDVRRLAALMTDAQFQRAFSGIGRSTVTGVLGTPTTLPLEARAGNLAIGDVLIYPDGRVSAVTMGNGKRSLTYFIKVGDRYLIDSTINLPPEATPTP